MKHCFRDGRGLPMGQGDALSQISHHYNRNVMERSNPAGLIGDNLFERLLLPLGRNRSDELERNDDNDEGVESLRTTFGLASPLLRPYITDSSRIQHRFNTSESRIVDEKVIERCSGGSETPKLVRSRYESGQEQGGYEAPGLAPTVYQLSSAQVLPWFNQKSIIPRWFLGRSSMDTRSQSCNHRGVTVRSSSKSGSRSGLGRYQVGTLSTYLPPFARYFIASEATDRQTIGKEQATDRQRTGKEKANKYQAKPKPIPEKEQGTDRERVENKQGITAVSTLGVLRQYIAGIVPIGIKRIYSRGIVCLTQALCKAIDLHNTYIIPTLYLHYTRIIVALVVCLRTERFQHFL
ncbi:hypothetical protein [Sphingobacterium yanglingense]|uniref:Uncharacterized protein n=1 Tax=Sphingobacterium yanglingense TaxID=1437280 RepID=A0A4R6W4V8_9SPHI|nr:hypothetical protein [Sphingobacterium yanglingense]TDQ73754.1 hypothetical protein CLV99_4191 [Sphingobacterium yanglingense]